jgi:hypothetical protein
VSGNSNTREADRNCKLDGFTAVFDESELMQDSVLQVMFHLLRPKAQGNTLNDYGHPLQAAV